MQKILFQIKELPLVTLAFLEGPAIGGGADLALATDLGLMAEHSHLQFVHIEKGICSVWGGGARLIQLVGPSRATDILYSARPIGAAEAVSIGLANAQAPSEEAAVDYLRSIILVISGISGALEHDLAHFET